MPRVCVRGHEELRFSVGSVRVRHEYVPRGVRVPSSLVLPHLQPFAVLGTLQNFLHFSLQQSDCQRVAELSHVCLRFSLLFRVSGSGNLRKGFCSLILATVKTETGRRANKDTLTYQGQARNARSVVGKPHSRTSPVGGKGYGITIPRDEGGQVLSALQACRTAWRTMYYRR